MLEKIIRKVQEIEPKIIRYRRDFHKYPELGWTEYRTSSLIAKRLEDLGYEVKVGRDILKSNDRMGIPPDIFLKQNWERAVEQGGEKKFLESMKYGFTGVLGELSNGRGKTIALRFDIDALPIEESREHTHRPFLQGFSSVNQGVMHACGHDCHAAIGLGIAEVLISLKEHIDGKIILIFQPAEEGVKGAKSIVTKGVLKEVDALIGIHVKDYTIGEIMSGISGFKATSKFDVEIHGKPAHAGSNPQDGHNAIMAAATAILNLYGIARHRSGHTRVNVGTVMAGSGRNIIADKAYMEVETRGSTSELNSYMYEKVLQIIEHSSLMQNCTYRLKPMGEAPSGKSDEEMRNLVEKTAKEIGGYNFVENEDNNVGSEDFTYMMNEVQNNGGKAVYIGIGADRYGSGAHSHDFDVNEDALARAMILLLAVTLKFRN